LAVVPWRHHSVMTATTEKVFTSKDAGEVTSL